MHAMPNNPPDTYYTKERVISLLRLYTYLLDLKPPKDPEMGAVALRVFGPGGWREDAMNKRADIKKAKEWLEQRSPEAGFIVRAYYSVGLPLRALEPYLAKEFGKPVSYETIRRWRDDGVQLMSDYLSGRIL